MDDIIEKIYKSGLKFLEPLTPEKTYATIVNEAVRLANAESGSLFLERDRGLGRIYATSKELYQIKPRKGGFLNRSFTKREAFVVTIRGLSKIHPKLDKMGFKSVVFIPISYRQKSLGVLTVQSFVSHKFTSRELNILKLFGSMASLAIRKTELYSETKKALYTRDLFISMAAHELRTPLTSVNGYIQLLYSKLSGAETPESRWIEQLYWEGNRLTNLVNELLEMNRIKSGKLQYSLKECSLKEILERLKNNFKFSYPNRILVVKDCLENGQDSVVGDYDKIIQVFNNILDNAVKFSSEITPITMILKKIKNSFIIQIKDRGLGMHRKDLAKIFEGFQRGSGHNKEGMGLGLFLARDILTQLHGDIKITSKPNKGTLVEVELPATDYR